LARSGLKINWWLLWRSICFINRSICTCITCLASYLDAHLSYP
jgi:hypothetical protein